MSTRNWLLKISMLIVCISLLLPLQIINASSISQIFFDDFSTENDEWVDESNGHIFRSEENQWLEYYSARSATQRYYIPVNAEAEHVEFNFRFNTLFRNGNGGVAIGLVENLNAPLPVTPKASGFFVHIGGWKGNSMVKYGSSYLDGTFDSMSSDLAIKYGPFNTWRHLSLIIDDGNWKIVVDDDNGNVIGQLTGTMSQKHSGYNYIFVGNDYYGGWEDQKGLIDDIYLYGSLQNNPPDCKNATPSLDTLWPVDHKFVPIEVINVTDPDGDTINITIDAIFQDEPVDNTGDGSFSPDGKGVGKSTAEVRSERDGEGNGRVYHLFFTADDENGGACSGEVLVNVPKSMSKPSIDDGAIYDSTIGE